MDQPTAMMIRHLADEALGSKTVRQTIVGRLMDLDHEPEEISEHMDAFNKLLTHIAAHGLEPETNSARYRSGYHAGFKAGQGSATDAVALLVAAIAQLEGS